MKNFAIASIAALSCLAGPALAQSAPPLTSVSFRQLSSPTGGTESISPGQFSATSLHRGSTLTIIVREIGTGGQRRLTLNGQNWGSNSQQSMQPLCSQGGGSYGPCSPGQVVRAYDITFGIFASGPGRLTYQSTSSTSPLTTRSVSINLP